MNIINPNLKFNGALTPLNLNNLEYIIIHHTEARSATVEDIHRWHMNDNKWAGIGYNEYIRKDGTVFIGRGDNVGAHCAGYNSKSYGISLEGNFDFETIPYAQYNALIERLQFHKSRFKPGVKIVGHRDLNSTDCPGRLFPLSNVLSAVNNPISEIDLIVDNLVKLGITSSKDYWVRVLEGKEPVNLEYLKKLLGRVKV